MTVKATANKIPLKMCLRKRKIESCTDGRHSDLAAPSHQTAPCPSAGSSPASVGRTPVRAVRTPMHSRVYCTKQTAEKYISMGTISESWAAGTGPLQRMPGSPRAPRSPPGPALRGQNLISFHQKPNAGSL